MATVLQTPLDGCLDRANASALPEVVDDASHLRRLLEKQPSCLLRVGRDGLLLACNEAGLGLLGTGDLAQVLDRPLDEYFAPAHRAAWHEFRAHVWVTGAGFLECDLAPATDAGTRTVQLQAVALRHHPDGLESMLLAVRDTSTLRRLEESLLLKESRAEQQRLTAALKEQDAERARILEQRGKLQAALRDALVLAQQAASALRCDQQHNELVTNLQAELALAIADQKRLQMLLGRAEVEQQRLAAGHAADRAETERALGELTLLKNQILKSLDDQLVELRHWRETAFTLEPLAAAGRLAMQTSSELHDVMTTLDERARLLLSVSRVDASYRPIIESVHAAALRAASLARQLSRTHTEPTPDPEAP